MKNYAPREIAFTPSLFPPTMLRIQWELFLVSHRDHSLLRWDAFVGTGDERVSLGMGPWWGPQQREELAVHTGSLVTSHIDVALRYLAEPPDPFPVHSARNGAPAA